MDFRQLKYFMAVAKAKSVTKASDSLHVAQPAVSMHIQRLEEELGEPLFVRHSRGVELTEAGAYLEQHASSILEQLETVRRDLRDYKGVPRGPVRIGMPRTISSLIALDVLRECKRLWPRVKPSLIEGLSGGVNELLFDGRLDFALTFMREESDWVSYEPLLHDELCFIYSGKLDVPHAKAGTIKFKQLERIPLALPTGQHGVRSLVESAARSAGIALQVDYEVDSFPVILDLVREGIAGTIHAVGSVTEAITANRLKVLRIVQPDLSCTLYCTYATKPPKSKAFVAVRELVRERVEAMIKSPHSGTVFRSARLGDEAAETKPKVVAIR
jgi:LysR family nitrogen assimilation transcriptional regulator